MREDSAAEVGRFLGDLFLRPWVAMVAWGSFVHMSELNLPFLSYWEMFMLNCVYVILTSTQIIGQGGKK